MPKAGWCRRAEISPKQKLLRLTARWLASADKTLLGGGPALWRESAWYAVNFADAMTTVVHTSWRPVHDSCGAHVCAPCMTGMHPFA